MTKYSDLKNKFNSVLDYLVPRANVLRNLYLVLGAFLILLIIATPKIITGPVGIFGEETAEVVLITFLFLVGFSVYYLYHAESQKSHKRLNEAMVHIGSVNIQISQIKNIFSDITKYPESKSDLRNILRSLADRVLGIVGVEWVLFRVVETDGLKTLTEFSQSRGGSSPVKCTVSNKGLIGEEALDACSVVESSQNNLSIKTFCVLPRYEMDSNQKVLVQAIVDSLGMIYLIYNSLCSDVVYQKSNFNLR